MYGGTVSPSLPGRPAAKGAGFFGDAGEDALAPSGEPGKGDDDRSKADHGEGRCKTGVSIMVREYGFCGTIRNYSYKYKGGVRIVEATY